MRIKLDYIGIIETKKIKKELLSTSIHTELFSFASIRFIANTQSSLVFAIIIIIIIYIYVNIFIYVNKTMK